MNRSTRDALVNMSNKLEDNDQLTSVKKELVTDSVSSLRTTIASFIQKRLISLTSGSDLEEVTIDALTTKVKAGEVPAKDLIYILTQLKSKNIQETETLLNLFKPTQGDSVPLFTKYEEESPGETIFKDSSPETLRKLQKIYEYINFNEEEK